MLCGLVVGESRKVIKDKEATTFILRKVTSKRGNQDLIVLKVRSTTA